ncbi:MAG: winged helix-turn-helix domain-containing protein [Planctomycetes bacterium]|nr:winged helix-turn-helix domain-containing protein [Planctomycetota bacterium]
MNRTLFDDADPRRIRRRTDPEPSHLAAVDAAERLPEQQSRILGIVTRAPNCTATELAMKYGLTDVRTVNRRTGELERRGLIERGDARKCRVTGRKAAVWRRKGEPPI